jgi:hypothetical protein
MSLHRFLDPFQGLDGFWISLLLKQFGYLLSEFLEAGLLDASMGPTSFVMNCPKLNSHVTLSG